MYYPKSQITTNLYTNGNELYIQSNNNQYVGYYYKTSNGSYFSGKTPQDGPNIRLVSLLPIVDNIQNNNLQYINVSLDSIDYPLFEEENILLPYSSVTLPTQQDYQIGEMRRYFCKKINEISYLEINKDIYDKLIRNDITIAFQYYQPFDISWQLIGDETQVYKTNRNIVELTMKQKTLPKFNEYLKKEYTKYYRNTA